MWANTEVAVQLSPWELGTLLCFLFALRHLLCRMLELQLKRKCHGLWPDLLLLMMIIMMRLPLRGAARLMLLIQLILFIGLTTPPVRCHKCLVSTRPATCDLSHCMQSHCWHVTCNFLGSNQRKINKCVSVECVCVCYRMENNLYLVLFSLFLSCFGVL